VSASAQEWKKFRRVEEELEDYSDSIVKNIKNKKIFVKKKI